MNEHFSFFEKKEKEPEHALSAPPFYILSCAAAVSFQKPERVSLRTSLHNRHVRHHFVTPISLQMSVCACHQKLDKQLYEAR